MTLHLKVHNRNTIFIPLELPDQKAAEALIKAIRRANKADRYVFAQNKKDEYWLELRDAKGQIICKSHVYPNRANSKTGYRALRKAIPAAITVLRSEKVIDV